MPTSIIPIFAVARQRLGCLKQFSSRIARRDRCPKSLQVGFEKMVGDDQRLGGLAGIAAADRNSLIGSLSKSIRFGF
jgi:hypothetical protein